MATVKQKRGALKKRITEFTKYVEGKEKIFADKRELGKAELIELEMRAERVTPVLDIFCELKDEASEEGDNSDAEDAEVDAFERVYFSILSRARVLINEVNQSTVRAVVASPAASMPTIAPAIAPTITSHGNAQIKLPTINLPKFCGERTKFLEFRDTYEALIHMNTEISDIQKLHYLKSALDGDAKQVIQHIEIAANNYSIAWSLLCARYENKRLLIKNHLAELFSSGKIEKESSIKLRELLDNMNKHLGALKTLGEPVDEWDTLIVFVISSKFDDATAREWEGVKPAGNFPSKEELLDFLTKKVDMLDSLSSGVADLKHGVQTGQKSSLKARNNIAMLNNISCYCCKESHTIYNCEKFNSLSIEARIAEIKTLKLCINCLRPGHMAKECQSTGCRKCKRKHNTLLHLQQGEGEKQGSVVTALSAKTHISDFTLLPTAMVNVLDFRGKPQGFRALLDSGSQSNFISTHAARRLRLPIKPFEMSVNGINNCTTKISGRCIAKLESNQSKWVAEIDCLVLPTVSHALPQISLSVNDWQIPDNIKLADPQFKNRGEIDMLLGAAIFSKILLQNQICLGKDKPLLQNTLLGWIVFGPMPHTAALQLNQTSCHFSIGQHNEIYDQLQRFWELEECPTEPKRSNDEMECEKHFRETHTRERDGRFSVSIPFRKSVSELGNSVSGARNRFYSLERKLQANPKFGVMYREFMAEYEALGHMSRIPDIESWEGIQYVIPHHGVVNDSSTTTKLRVVFDASFKTSSGFSRNDLERVGPLIQDDLFGILVRFRQHAIAITGDIAKMYRQVLINPADRHLQRILFRASPADELKAYELNTVTYGTASASFLAIRALHQLAEENAITYPRASATILSDFYVDDLLTGAETVEDARALCVQITQILEQGRFPIRKWVSSNNSAISMMSNESDGQQLLEIGEYETTKILGLHWCPSTDSFHYTINAEIAERGTKRCVLSAISKIFDPLGLLGPCIIRSKILLQTLWQDKIGWDDQVSSEIQSKWSEFGTDLALLNRVSIPRRVTASNSVNLQIHGFADASERAYGACVYMRTSNSEGSITCSLICAKSKVAPLKTSTIPRLELCAALLLARLTNRVIASSQLKINEVYLWSDATIVLGWLKTPVNLLKIFVANRIVQILELVSVATWRHVPTSCNPADLISRGVGAEFLIKSSLWWNGPDWLMLNSESWPTLRQCNDILPDLRPSATALLSVKRMNVIDQKRFSNFSRLRRAMAYCYRFIENCRRKGREKIKGSLSVKELNRAEIHVLRQIQEECFGDEIEALNSKDATPRNSKIKALLPYLDEDGILRVTGRLQNADLSYQQAHPIILPAKHYVSKLIFRYEHKRFGHAGPQHLLSIMRERYWPVRGRDMARQAVHECVRCNRVKPVNNLPIMGSLPSARVKPSYPFETTGVDYAGPFLLKNKKGRGAKLIKSYIALFVCFASKAIHLEVVSDLTTEAFIATLRRFIARRGKPQAMHSDNATNFVGTNNELRQIVCKLESNKEYIQDMLAEEGIEWHFIPPQAPHFGGIWEAGVKSTKNHLKRILGNASLTFEEFTTVCCQIEAMLNSRPLCPLTNNPDDLEPLTPAHFLIGRKMMSITDASVQHLPTNRLSNFQRLQQLSQHFWNRWSKEYLPTLQTRKKWITECKVLQLNQLVLIQDNNAPPLRWALGRIIELHPGKDTVVRVVTLRTQAGVLKRPVSKVFPLPLEQAPLPSEVVVN